MAEAAGVSMSAFLEQLIAHEEIDEHGRPVWWTEARHDKQEELPLKTA